MQNIHTILSLITTGTGLLIATLTFLIKFIKSEKSKKIFESCIKLSEIILPLIEQAENFVEKTGAEKKDFVVSEVLKIASEQNIEFSAEFVNKKIEELIALTKKVNYK